MVDGVDLLLIHYDNYSDLNWMGTINASCGVSTKELSSIGGQPYLSIGNLLFIVL